VEAVAYTAKVAPVGLDHALLINSVFCVPSGSDGAVMVALFIVVLYMVSLPIVLSLFLLFVLVAGFGEN
jgi:hypothetical protein